MQEWDKQITSWKRNAWKNKQLSKDIEKTDQSLKKLNDDEDENEKTSDSIENAIENVPQSLLNATMSEKKSSDERSRNSEWSPESYDSDCNSEQHSLNMELNFLTEMRAREEDD